MTTQSQAQKPIVLKMRVVNSLVTADISDCPMQMALQDLADRSGIVFEVRSQDNPLVSVHPNQVDFHEAIQRISPNHNVIFFYDQDKSERIILAQVYPRARPVQQPGLVYLGTGAVTKNNEEVDTPEQALKVLDGNARLEVKVKAINILIQNKSNETIKALAGSLSDPAPEVRVAVIESFVSMGAHSAVPEIVKCLKDPHPTVRQSAIMAIGDLGNDKNIKDLKPLSADKDPSIAAFADMAMKKLAASAGK